MLNVVPQPELMIPGWRIVTHSDRLDKKHEGTCLVVVIKCMFFRTWDISICQRAEKEAQLNLISLKEQKESSARQSQQQQFAFSMCSFQALRKRVLFKLGPPLKLKALQQSAATEW